MEKSLKKNKIYLIFSNALIYFGILIWSMLALPLGYSVLIVYRRKPTLKLRRRLYWMIHWYGKVILQIIRPWVPVAIPERKTLIQNAPCVVIANHQSMLDLFLFAAQEETNFCYVMKSWPLKLFFYAPFMRALGYIIVDGLNLESFEDECQTRLQEGISIVFFPEGTRSRDGSIGKFHSGAFRIACNADVPLVPILFENSGQVVPVGSLLFHPQILRMRFLDPLYPIDYKDNIYPHRKMMRDVRNMYISEIKS